MDAFRRYSTIGIEGFVCGPSDPLPSSYLRLSSSSSDAPLSPSPPPPQPTSSFTSWEIIGVVKERPEDFVVREIMPKDDVRFSKIISRYNAIPNTNTNKNDTSSTDGDVVVHNDQQLRIATMPSGPPITLPSNNSIESSLSNQSKRNPTECESVEAQPPGKKVTVGENGNAPSMPTQKPTGNMAKSVLESLPPELSLEETIRMYIKKVATPEHPGTALLKSIEELNEKATNRIPTCHDGKETLVSLAALVAATPASDGTNNGNNNESSKSVAGTGSAEVWIPPLHLSGDDVEKDSHNTSHTTNDVETATEMCKAIADAETRAQRKAFHRAIRIAYPFLKTESSATSSTSYSPNETGTVNGNNDKGGEHWIKIKIDDCFDELVQHLCTPRDDLRELFLFRNRGFEGASPSPQPKSATTSTATTTSINDATIKPRSSVVLRLRPGVSKDDRRTVHHILALKNKHFESSIRHQESKKKTKKNHHRSKQAPNDETAGTRESESPAPEILSTAEATTTDLFVSWKKQALRKGSHKNNKKRKRFENDNGKEVSSNFKTDTNLLCVLKKTQKEHLTTMQILSRGLRCRQSDIGFAGIKDMQAITYQFITLRSMGQHRAERAIRQQLQSRNVQLKILCSNVDFVLNIGDLEGNQFEITIRNLKRVKVDLVDPVPPGNGKGILEPAKESFVDCDSTHIDRMVERIQQHGFINFYGEQRIGTPGRSEEVGVRAFEIGRAMLRQNFMGAIQLLMEGKRHNETDEVRRVRQAWKDSNGDPSLTLKAFGRADIMPRERAVLRGLNRYPDNPLEAIRFLNYNMRMFYINAYQSYIFNRIASRRVRLHGDTVVKGDLYFDKDGDHRDDIKVVDGNEAPPISICQIVLPLPGYNVQYPTNEVGQLYRDLLETDSVKFEKNAPPEATANGSYRKLVVHPGNLRAVTDTSDSSMKLSFQLPKGCYATMLLRELMLTTVIRSNN